MIVRRYTDPAAYRDRVHAFLEREEAVNNLPLGIVYRLAEASQRTETPVRAQASQPLLALVEEQGQVVFAMVMTPPHNMIVYGEVATSAPTQPLRPPGEGQDTLAWRPPEGEAQDTLARRPPEGEGQDVPPLSPQEGGGVGSSSPPAGGIEGGAIEFAVSFLLREGISPPGVIGPRDVATRFSSAWCARTGCTSSVRTDQMIYRLDRVNPIAYSPGSLIQAAEAHLDLVAEWMTGFSEVTPEGPLERAEAQARAKDAVGAGRVYLWRDSTPVSMAWKTRPTQHGITVSGVYTPRALRRHGYATSCVAALSQLLLDEGYAYCTLYTDLANPTSNHIYQEIGYRPIRASIDMVFAPPAE
jgi:GNAT superfamily N-acetyltransferase